MLEHGIELRAALARDDQVRLKFREARRSPAFTFSETRVSSRSASRSRSRIRLARMGSPARINTDSC
jgi:hypothetical protein